MFLKGHMQNAYVTHDIDKAMEIVSNRYGIDAWQRIEPDMVIKTVDGDKPLVCRVASAWVGGLNLEIIQPVSGYVDHYVSMLPNDKSDAVPRFHHISLRRDDEAAMRAEIAQLGLPLAFEGQSRSRIRSRAWSSSTSMAGKALVTTLNSPGKAPRHGSSSVGPKADRSNGGRRAGAAFWSTRRTSGT